MTKRFIQHIQIVEDTLTGRKFVIDSQNICGIVTELLNALNDENKQLKQEKQKIFDYIDKQIRVNYNELKLWEKSNNKARKEKQVSIREMNIMCLYNLLRNLKGDVE